MRITLMQDGGSGLLYLRQSVDVDGGRAHVQTTVGHGADMLLTAAMTIQPF